MNRFISITLLLLILININISFAESNKWYKLYKERVGLIEWTEWEKNKNICKKYKPKTSVYKTEEYKDYSKDDKNHWGSSPWNNNDLEKAKYVYRKNMNNIYKCWIISIQKNSLEIINNLEIKTADIKNK